MIVSGLRNKILREGIPFRRMLKDLKDSQFYSRAELENYQDERLRKIIKHAYENVPYYNELFNKCNLIPEDLQTKADLWKIPLLTKDDIKQNFERLKARNIPKFFMNIGHTSGTTGTPAHFYRDLYSINFENAVVRRQWEWANFFQGNKLAVCRGIQVIENERTKPPFWSFNKYQNHLYLSSFHMSEGNLVHYVQVLKEYKPKALQAYPSTAYSLARALKLANEKLQLNAVFTSSEPLYSYQRDLIEEVFQCKIWDFYGMAERVISASECESHNGLHINEEYGITEFMKNNDCNDEEGIMIGTSLHNFGMPLIRYITNDYGKVNLESCICGRKHRLLYPIETKQEDMIVTSDGRWVSPSIITHAFKPLTHVAKSQVIQHDFDTYEVLIVPEEGYTSEETNVLLYGLKERFGKKSNIQVNIVSDIPRTKNGKFRWVISHVSGGEVKK